MSKRREDTHSKTLKKCIRVGNKEEIYKLLQRNVKLIDLNTDGDTVLHLTVRSRKFSTNEIIEMLDVFISKGVDTKIKNRKQKTVMHLAIERQMKDVIEFLLTKNNIDMADTHFIIEYMWMKYLLKPNNEDTSTPKNILKKDVEEKSIEFIEWLITKGFDFDQRNDQGKSALHLAIDYNLQHILPTLLKHTKDINFVSKCHNQTLLHLFLQKSNTAKVFGYEFQSINPNGTNDDSYRKCVDFNTFSKRYDIEIVKIMLDKGIVIDHEDKPGLTSVFEAIDVVENMDIVEMLLERLTNISDKHGVTLLGSTIMNMVQKYKHKDYYLKIWHALVAKGVNFNGKDKNGTTPMYYAFEFKNLYAIELMREKATIDFGVITNSGENLFHALARKQPKQFMKDEDQKTLFDILIKEGCDVSAKNDKNQTPLHVAIRHDNFFIAKNLILNGADINCRENDFKWSPLHVAIYRGSLEIVELLLARGTNVNSQSHYGRPLHMTISNVHKMNKQAFELLLKNGAYVNAKDHEGKTAFDKALRVDRESDFEKLLAHGLDIHKPEDDSTFWKYSSTYKLFLQHSLKLSVVKLLRFGGYQYSLKHEEYDQLYAECEQEFEILKSTTIDSKTSLYTWLHMNSIRRYFYSHSKDFQAIINSPTLKQQFPQYSTIILGKYRQCLARKALWEPAKKTWLELIKIHLPDICLDCIFSYLSTNELFEFTETLNELI